ncbi:MAG: hypothetical protein A2W22_00165 [Candidatus Levybacteria bacterium RBG_16_35_11]|nr:MAG: hypothetical protein A2W22_00165 [Candidatus Levybacteria bacterium RBG_16_35_11]
MKREFLAQFVSLALGPLTFLVLMPLIIVYRQTGNLGYALTWELFSLFFITVGVALLFIGRGQGVFSDFDLSIKAERQKFYHRVLILALIYFIATALIKGLFFHLTVVIFSTLLIIVAFTVANNFIKASIHLGIVCAFVFSMGLFFGPYVFIWLFFLIPLMAWSRFKLKKHTLKEMLTGGLLGTAITLFSFFSWKFLI